MAVIKCKMCGGDLQVIEGATVCECEYCGSRQTVPTADNEKKMTLFTRASRLLRNCEFDKASAVFEAIVADFPEEAEAYWGLVLCKYGIEYVDDPATGKKIPTCHRSSFDSVLDDSNFEQACEYTDAVARRVYRDEARAIEELRKNIIEVSGKEEPYDVFISYKETDENGDRTLDSVIAQDIYRELTDEGYRVFFSRISLESKLGTEYEPYIFAALNSAKVMIVVGTDYENFDAVWVKNEWSRFLKLIVSGQKKTLIPVFKNMDAYDMPKEFAKLSAQDMGKVGAMQDLVRGVEKLVGKKEQPSTKIPTIEDSGLSALNAQTASMVKRGYMMLGDGDYKKADEFFERALNNDAECGQAYWGKALADAQVPNAEKYGSIFLFSRLQNNAEEKTVNTPTIGIVELARKEDENGWLKDFSDEELEELLSDLKLQPIQLQSTKEYYEMQKRRYGGPETMQKLADNRDYDRAVKYGDNVIREWVQATLDSLKVRIADEIRGEEKRILDAEKESEVQKVKAVTTIKNRLEEISHQYNDQRRIIEDEQRRADEQVEKAYQEALQQHEMRYQEAIAAQNSAYQQEVATWEQMKHEYDQKYESVVAEHQKLEVEIEQLEAERSNLHGLFTGKRRKEIDDNLTLLRKSLNETTIPKDPGPRPEKPKILQKDEAPKKDDFKSVIADSRAIELQEIVKCCLSPAYKERKDNINKFKNKNPGDEIQFGNYLVDENKTAAIDWKVLAKENGCLLVISKYGLDNQKFHTERVAITWEKCSLREWLNNSFMKAAFSPAEQAMVSEVTVPADKNPFWGTDPGKSTQDKVFLLSVPEVRKYFHSDSERQCMATKYAINHGSEIREGGCWWWTRSPGGDTDIVANVVFDGSAGKYGGFVDLGNTIRPALWINCMQSDENEKCH